MSSTLMASAILRDSIYVRAAAVWTMMVPRGVKVSWRKDSGIPTNGKLLALT